VRCYQVRIETGPLLSAVLVLVVILLIRTRSRIIYNNNRIVGNNNKGYQLGRLAGFSEGIFEQLFRRDSLQIQQSGATTNSILPSQISPRACLDHWMAVATTKTSTLVSVGVVQSSESPSAAPEQKTHTFPAHSTAIANG